MRENRKSPRFTFHSPPRALIEGISGGETVLLDISVTGCRVACDFIPNVKMDSKYIINIIPEKEAHIGSFTLTANSIWIRKAEFSCEIGFFILKSPEGKLFERYVDYLDWRTSKNAGTKDE